MTLFFRVGLTFCFLIRPATCLVGQIPAAAYCYLFPLITRTPPKSFSNYCWFQITKPNSVSTHRILSTVNYNKLSSLCANNTIAKPPQLKVPKASSDRKKNRTQKPRLHSHLGAPLLAPIQLAGGDVAAGGGGGGGRGGAAAGARPRGAAGRRPGAEHRRHRADGGVLVLRGQVLRPKAPSRGTGDAHVQPVPEGRANGEIALDPLVATRTRF
jgi:hypothetical protein